MMIPLPRLGDSGMRGSGEDSREVGAWRRQLWQSANFWAAAEHRDLDSSGLIAMSGLKSAWANWILCTAGGSADPLRNCVDEVSTHRVPAMIAVGGEALGWVQVVGDAGWVCIGSQPLMALRLREGSAGHRDPYVGRIGFRDLSRAREIIGCANATPSAALEVLVPDSTVRSDSLALWGIEESGALVSVLIASTAEDAVVVWSMATLTSYQGRGLGRRLLEDVLTRAASERCTVALLTSTPAGRPLYASAGFSVVEHWQMWSRPRWVLGRS